MRFTLPNATEGMPSEAWIHGGKYGLIFAEDTEDVAYGHGTEYPSSDATVAFSIPTEGNVTPKHTVLHDGPCLVNEIGMI